MSRIPFQKTYIHCPLPTEEAWQRLCGVTREQTGLPLRSLVGEFVEEGSNIRYAGKLSRYQFRLRRVITVPPDFRAVLYFGRSTVNIAGQITANAGGCRVTIRIWPKVARMLFWIFVIAILAVTVSLTMVEGGGPREIWLVIAGSAAILTLEVFGFISDADEEVKFLHSIFNH